MRKAEKAFRYFIFKDVRFRKHGIARELMLLLKKRALGHGINHLGLGAVESAEGFYQKLGYTGTLLVQSEKHGIEELLSINEKYPVIRTSVYDGTVNQVFLDLRSSDRKFDDNMKTPCRVAIPKWYSEK